MKKHLSTIILILVFLVGLSVLLYPTISDYVNSRTQTRAIIEYSETVSQMDAKDYSGVLQAARDYNQTLVHKPNRFILSDSEKEEYNQLLNVAGNGIMCYLEIDSINVRLPVYHGTDDAVLQVGIGHIEGSSLPVGGIGTHTVVSGHRGLPSAKILSNLDKLAVGDIFSFITLEEVLTYEIDQILIVEPEETAALNIASDMDYATLVTCTPYGVNSHRLLVRGHRVDSDISGTTHRVVADAQPVDSLIVAVVIAVILLVVLLIVLLLKNRRRRGGRS